MKIRYFSKREIAEHPKLASYCFNGEELNLAIILLFDDLKLFARALVADEGDDRQQYIERGNNLVIVHVNPDRRNYVDSYAGVPAAMSQDFERQEGLFIQITGSPDEVDIHPPAQRRAGYIECHTRDAMIPDSGYRND